MPGKRSYCNGFLSPTNGNVMDTEAGCFVETKTRNLRGKRQKKDEQESHGSFCQFRELKYNIEYEVNVDRPMSS